MVEQDSTSSQQKGRAFRVVLIYAVFAALWILLSDMAVETMFSDPMQIIRASMIKGWLFVAVTTVLLYILARRLADQLQAAHGREVASYLEKQRSHDLLSAIVDNSDDAIFAKDTQGCYMLFNNAACRFVGKSAAEVLGRDDSAIFPSEQAEALMAISQRVIAGGHIETNEETLDTPQGMRIFLATKGPLRDAAGKVIGTFGISRDITKRKKTDAALYQSEEKLRSIVRVAPTGIGMVVNRVFTEVNQKLEAITGYSREELIGQSARMLYPSDADYEHVGREKYRQIAEHGSGMVETRFRCKDGTIIDVLLSSTPIDPADIKRGVIFTALDITQRKQAEAGLTQLNADLSATLQAIPDLLFEVDDTGRYIKISATAHNLLVAPAEQLLGHTVQEMLPPDAAQAVMDALANAALIGADYGRTIRLPLAAGPHDFELSVARKQSDSGQRLHFIVLSRDITERKVATEELRRRNEELERFNCATVGRELDMIELKKQINALAREVGREPPFALSFLEPAAAGETSHEA